MDYKVLCRQFILLLWKNFILQIRRPLGTVFEIFIPPLAVLFVIGLRFGLFDTENQCFVTFDSDHLTLPLAFSFDPATNTTVLPQDYVIYYTPDNENTVDIVNRTVNKLAHPTAGLNILLNPVNTTDELVDGLQGITQNSSGCFKGGAGIVFNNLLGNNIAYTLRLRHEVGELNTWYTQMSAPEDEEVGPRVSDNFYLTEGFLHLENAVGQSIIEWKTGEEANFIIDVRQFPYPKYRVDFFLETLGSILATLLMLCFLYSAGIFVKELVLEKETRIRESMFMMGLSQWVLWSTWYLKQFIFLFISIFLMTVLLKAGQIFPKSDFFLLLILFTLFALATVSWGFLISVWFDTARVGLLIGFLAWFVNYLPVIFLPQRYDQLTLGAKLAACILSNTCMGLGITVIARLEIRQEGLQWDNIAEPLSLDDDFHVGYVYMMLILDAIVYYVIAWYVNAVKPGQYGVPKPLYFPFLPSYWLGRPRTSKTMTANYPATDEKSTAFEEEPRDLEIGISIQNLTKIYDKVIFQRKKKGKRSVAVDSISLNMYKGQITALLGHNGAGKTTTMSILTGLYTPTSGTATINGNSILTDIDQIRRNLGICPQHNVLFDRLTVTEHLKFFCRLKGVWGKRVNDEVQSMIEDLQLVDKKNTTASQLSGGMKRKLSVGIALMGGSEIVVLDEPTSGMDPYARRATWDLLIKRKEGRTILLTTHFMDEADLLGDRIAIMAEGRLKCSGSSLFLKSKYGVGYRMVIVKQAACNSTQVTELVKSFVEEAQQVTDVGAELSFLLPSSSSSTFPSLFNTLEAQKTRLGISSFGISVTTMEEVFIKVGEGTDETLDHSGQPPGIATTYEENKAKEACYGDVENTEVQPVTVEFSSGAAVVEPVGRINERKGLTEVKTPTFSPNSGIVLWVQQFCAMFLKRFFNSLRFWPALISQLLLPLIFVLLALVLAVTLPDPNVNDPKRALKLQNSALSNNVILFYADFRKNEAINFGTINPSSLGATDIRNYTDDIEKIIMETMANNYNTTGQCCDYEHQLLDTFCSTRTPNDLDICRGDFGYSECKQCLKCCEARSAKLPSCTNPSTLSNPNVNLEDYCPSPPLVSISMAEEDLLSGRLDSDDIYAAEHLLNVAEDQEPSVFFRRVQAGFLVTSKREPSYSLCGCALPNETCSFAGVSFDNTTKCPYLTVSETSVNITCPPTLDGCYSVDGMSANSVQSESCAQEEKCGEPMKRPVGASYPDQENQLAVTIWYNNQPLHMSAAALAAFHNIWLQQIVDDDDISITVYNHPLPRNIEAQVDSATQNFNGYAIGTLTVFGYSFLIASFVLFLVQEKESKAKHLQFVSGVHVTSYWMATFAWDLLNALIPLIITLILFASFELDAYTGDGLAAVFLLFLFTMWASIPLTYCFSFLFSNSLAAFGILIIFYYFTATIMETVVFLVEDQDTADILHYIFLVVPSYGLAIGLVDIYTNNVFRDACEMNEQANMFCDNPDSGIQIRYVDSPLAFARPAIGSILLYMAIEGVLFFMLTLLIEHSFFYSKTMGVFVRNESGTLPTHREDTSTEPLIQGEDSDVFDERKKVMSGATSEDDVIIIKNLQKVYSRSLNGCTIRPQKTALRGISLAIPKGECFGLLGVNGAGKTTTFSILTGDISMTSGTATIAGFDIRTNLQEVQQRIGYCPQFDALLERLTGRELLTMFARLRGIPEQHIKEVVEIEVKRLDLAKHADKRCGAYSGGNKRKLSTAIALVGNPPIILLDEPTTGMDPVTRRFLWDVLTSITQQGNSIILSSHSGSKDVFASFSMEECEALCTRLAIMVNGYFKCLGSIQHLKNKFGTGFTLQAKVKLSSPSLPEPAANPRDSPRFGFESDNRSRSPAQIFVKSLSPPPSLVRKSPVPPSEIVLGGPTTFNPFDTTTLHIFIREAFSGAILLEEHQGAVTYQLPTAGVSWSSLFRQLEDHKERLGIVDYSVSQTTLEQVFINFAKEQEDSED